MPVPRSLRISPAIAAMSALVCLLLAGCGGGAAPATPGQWVAMSNPAAQYCAEMGGRLEHRQEQAGQAGYCHLPNGTIVEEWQLFRGKNAL